MKKAAALLMVFFWLSSFLPQAAFAHIPVIVKTKSSKENPVLVKKPEISYAYYGQLAGTIHYYKIEAPKAFLLYVNILVPDYSPKSDPILRHDMSFEVWKDNVCLFSGEGLNVDWRRFYEKYGRDHYYMGSEFERQMDAGTYLIRVFNTNNTGKYSLAIGKKEKFTVISIIGAFFKAWSLDRWFFKK
jgi:hypothetical protein